MPHVLVAGKLHPSGIALLDAAPGITYDYVEEVSEPSYAPHIEKADALVIRTQPLSASTVAMARRLKIVSRHGVGYDAVDLPSLNERGIALSVVGDVNSVSVAEHAMMLLLAAAKRTVQGDRAVRGGNWSWRNRLEPVELAGKNLLVIGYGRIGRHLARMAAGFGMHMKGYDPYLERNGWPTGPATPAPDLRAALAWADAVSIHVPKGDRPVIGAEELRAMRRSAIIVNTSRGGAVDEAALAAALGEGRIAAAGLDVFEDEPRVHPALLGRDDVVLLPHLGSATLETRTAMGLRVVENVAAWREGRPLRDPVT